MSEDPGTNSNEPVPEGHKSRGRVLLEGTKTLEEILRVATSFELTAYNFYTSMIPRVSKNIRYLVEELAAEEKRHYELFQQLARTPGIGEQIRQEILTPVSDHRFSDYVLADDLGDEPDDQAILQYALGREHAAMEQYRELANSTEPGPVHELFEFLADEETKHKQELEKTYYETVHSGGV